jgi:hypothetical protein
MSETSDIEVGCERAAKNHTPFLPVNKRIEELSTPSYSRGFICECQDVRATRHSR